MKNDKNQLINEIMRASGGKINNTAAKEAAQGNVSALMENLSESDKAKLNSILSDEKATRQLLSSDAAKALMKLFYGK